MMTEAGWEVFGKVYEVDFTDFLTASAKADAPSTSASSSPPAPEPPVGGSYFDGVYEGFIVACLNDPLFRANWSLRVHAQVARSPLVACLVSHVLGWSPTQMLAEAAKQKRLLLEHWRKRSGLGDKADDEASEQQVSSWSVFQPDLTKPPPQTFKPSPSWLTPSSPRSQRAPDLR